jgi:hypothetical protein
VNGLSSARGFEPVLRAFPVLSAVSLQDFWIPDMFRGLVTQVADDVAGDHLALVPDHIPGSSAEVGCTDDVIQGKKGVVLLERFLVEDVQGCPLNPLLLQSVEKGLFVREEGAGCVD